MSDIPPMDVAVISTDDQPTGIGEAGVPAVAPAIANAVAQLTGKRLRHLPMTPERVEAVARDNRNLPSHRGDFILAVGPGLPATAAPAVDFMPRQGGFLGVTGCVACIAPENP